MRGLLALGATLVLLSTAPSSGQGLAGSTGVAAPSTPGAKIWVGRHAEFQECLRSSPVERMEKVGEGVTDPDRAFFVKGAVARCALVKVLPPGRQNGYWESYKSEIAAYELDRLLGLDMVPVTVERQVGGKGASAQLWLDGCRLLKSAEGETPPRVRQWGRQVCRQRIFDALIANIDRNAGNILIDDQWNLILIDHSRAFARNETPFLDKITQTDRELYEALKALDEATVMDRLLPWLFFGEKSVRELMQRRDRIVARLDALIDERGEAAVLPF